MTLRFIVPYSSYIWLESYLPQQLPLLARNALELPLMIPPNTSTPLETIFLCRLLIAMLGLPIDLARPEEH